MADSLTVARLFADPPLNFPTPLKVRFSPDGQFITYTLLSEDDRERQDLWAYDCTENTARRLLDARTIAAGELSEADKERLERQRQFVGGVTDYAWFPDNSAILLPLQGRAYKYRLHDASVTELVPTHASKGEMRLSNSGRFLTYVIDGNLYAADLSTAEVYQITDDGSDVLSNGVADFIAQEEMHRFEGYWWSADDSELVFTKVDTSPIPESRRQEINADGVTSVLQRYPFAGGPNADIALFSYKASTAETHPLLLPLEDDDYLARVTFVGNTLTAQVQDRSQQNLSLLARNAKGEWEAWHHEHSDTWINLHDNLMNSGDETVLWTSEINGQSQLMAGPPGAFQAITPEQMHVVSLLGCDRHTAWVTGWDTTPTEQHLYAVPLNGAEDGAQDGAGNGGETRQLTHLAGWHQCTVHRESGRFVTAYSSIREPPQLLLCELSSGDTTAVLHDNPVEPSHPYAPYLTHHQTPTFGTLPAEDGATLHYRLTKPAALAEGQRAPVIVYVYGGPGVQKVRNEWAPLLLQLFAQNGFGVFELDNRGSTNRGRVFEAPLYKAMGQPEVADQVKGVAALADYDWVDPDRVGVFGHSYGGYMALMCLCKASGVFRAGVAAAPVSDWRLYDTHYTERFMGHPQTDKNAYDASAVLPWLDKLTAQLLLMHGMADDNVLFTHSTLLMRELQRLNKKFELMTYPGSKHALQERDVSIHRFELILDFFRRAL